MRSLAYYKAYIANDGGRYQVSVVWDENDPNRFISAPFPLADNATDEDLVHELGRAGYRLVSFDSDNFGRGWAIVARRENRHCFYDPISQEWYSFLSDAQKSEIRKKYPDARVAGVSV